MSAAPATPPPGGRRAASAPGRRRATYRVQMRASFDFDDAAALTDYLRDLGVSHLYSSPILQASAGSSHGYDVVDPTRVNVELGGAEGLGRLRDALDRAGLLYLLDVVPNHMAITGRENAWWWDVLENGPASIYARYFDVDWDSPERKLRNVVSLPILADQYGRELEAGRMHLERDGGRFYLAYFDHQVPLDPRSVGDLLAQAAERVADHGAAGELESVANAFARLPRPTRTDPESVHERNRDKEILRDRLARLLGDYQGGAEAVGAVLAGVNRDPDQLDALLDQQNYRLSWWRTAGEELDYRRFFDINDLAGLRVEDPEVFADSHQLVLGWLSDGALDGVRVDHVDGLRDPAAYLDRLAEHRPGAWLLVEKILEPGETLPSRWPIAGTTGYEWLNLAMGMLLDQPGWAQLASDYGAAIGEDRRYEEIVQQCKRDVLDGSLAADLNRLTGLLADICEGQRRYRDFTRRDLRECLAEVAVGFRVYRTYVRAGHVADPTDVAIVNEAVLAAAIRRPELDEELISWVRDLLLLRVGGDAGEELALRFQQLTSPVMAKAAEDTAFYRYLPLTALNEVGGDPGSPGVSVEDFHQACARAHEARPEALLATSTHDTKRSEDVRARLLVLAETAGEWAATVERWHRHHQERRSVALPDRNTEWLLYQTLVGAWPIDAPRLQAYMEKATHEAKEHTSWTNPDVFYDQALAALVAEMLKDEVFVADVEGVVAGIERPGWSNALAQKLLTLTAPGVPDLYQGSELFDLSLVDPDNRRAVDYRPRRQLLAALAGKPAAAWWAGEDGAGASKLAVVQAALRVRADHSGCFGAGPDGRYQPLAVTGPEAGHAVAFRRGAAVATVVTRLPVGLAAVGGFRTTTVTLPPGRWANQLGATGGEGEIALADLLGDFPVALLVREP